MIFIVKQKETNIDVSVNIDLGSTLDEAVEICGGGEDGAAIVLGKFQAAAATAIRARIDTLLNNKNPGKCLSPTQTIEKMENSYRITMGKQRLSDFEKAQNALAGLSSEDKEKMLALLRDSASDEAA